MNATPHRLVVLTNHFINSKRKANIHWLVREFGRIGWDVTVLITGFSALAKFRGDRRASYLNDANRRNFEVLAPGLRQSCLYTAVHPFNGRKRWINALLAPVASLYPRLALHVGAQKAVSQADLVLIESGVPLLFVPTVRRLAPQARLAYRVSDDVRHLRCHPAVADAEARHENQFDLISVPSRLLMEKFKKTERLRHHPHSLATDVLERMQQSPYPERQVGALRMLSVGSSFFDHDGLAQASGSSPEHQFFVVGDVERRLVDRNNVTYLGELPFEETVGYIQHCDVALALYDGTRAGPSLAETSNKIAQYLFFGKPVVTLKAVVDASSSRGLFGYEQGDRASMTAAVRQAISQRDGVPRQPPPSTWESIVRDMTA